MKFLKVTFSASQIKALLRKDILVRSRQPWMLAVQLIWPCLTFVLLFLIRLKYGPEDIADCQFPARLLPTKNNVISSFYSYICSIENKCMSTEQYEEYPKLDNAPMKPIIDIVQIFINDDKMFNAVVELPEKANFISAITTLFTSGHMDEIRNSVEKVIALVPQVEKFLNGNFDIKKLFSDRKTFVKGGYILCGHPFPSTESIPLVNDILYSEDFSEVNDDELNAMPTKYCKRLYLDVTSSNHGKLTWESIKPIIHGKILFAPENDDTKMIMQHTNVTFEELHRLQQLSVAVEQILTKLRGDEQFQKSFDSILKLAQSPFIKSIIGDEIDMDQVEAVINRIRTDPIIYDVITTIKNLLECFSVDRFVPASTETELRKLSYDLNQKRLFYAAVYFNKTDEMDVQYKLHMDTESTQPTIENRNRFWFPGPSRSMIQDLKYHRGFVQIKQSLDMAIIKQKKQQLQDLGIITETPTTTSKTSISVELADDGDEEDEDEDDDDDWFTNTDSRNANDTTNTTSSGSSLLSSFFSGVNLSDLATLAADGERFTGSDPEVTVELDLGNFTDVDEEIRTEPSVKTFLTADPERSSSELGGHIIDMDDIAGHSRTKRQSLFDLFGVNSESEGSKFKVDDLQFYTKQFPYPSYIHDDFKTGLYLAQAIQVAFYIGLVAQIASCVRHRIWMRESRNTMLMSSMGMKPCSEVTSWIIVTFCELLVIFVAITIILYVGGILMYTKWAFILLYLVIFGGCLIAFCYMCSTFFTSATIGAVATAILFFISFCPYIIVLMFDAKLNSLQNFAINLSFTTAFAHAWGQIMRMELQQTGLGIDDVLDEGLHSDFGFGLFMIVLDMFIYIAIGYFNQRYKDDEFRFIEVQRECLDSNVGATLTNVSKLYDDSKIAISNVSISFARDQVTCLLGRNGAGKSTIIKMLTGQVVQTTGRVILSQALTSSSEFDKIGVCSQDNILMPNLTAREHLEMYAKIKLKHGYKAEVQKTLKSLNFGDYESYQASQLSGGFQRRLCVAIAFIGSPNVVILDEPCNGVDNKARRDIWELINRLRKGRAVVFATHFLDEAEHLSDVIVIMKNGKIIARHNPETLKNFCTAQYQISLECCNTQTGQDIAETASRLLTNFKIIEKSSPMDLCLEIMYDQSPTSSLEFLTYLQDLQKKNHIKELSIESQDLEHLFKDLDRTVTKVGNGHAIDMMKTVKLSKEDSKDLVRPEPLTRSEAIHQLFWKRLVHFSRNYRMLLCVIILPAIFELLAMWFVAYRLEDDYDKVLNLSRDLYPESTQFLSIEAPKNFTTDVYNSLYEECSDNFPCREFSNSQEAFYWVLSTLPDYRAKRYGGYSFNDSRAVIWYNNKGYHAMMAWLNDLNTHLFQVELEDPGYTITTFNEPWKLGLAELTSSSILRQAGDSSMALILLIAFSLVVSVASVYLVNERMNGEKLQQRLCGVDAITYWGVAFIWDFLIIILAVMVCVAIILAFGMPVFVDRQQLWGLIVLALFFGFACIPAVHVFEKLFTDSSVAIVTIFCMNVIIPLFTMAVIVLLGVIGDSPTWDSWRYFLNRAFLIFPQHALGDGLLEICKNYMVALVFNRYDIDSYKNPVNSDLLMPHLIALFVVGLFFIILNVLLECGLLYRWKDALYRRIDCLYKNEFKYLEELKIVSIQNSLKRTEKTDAPQAIKVDNLCKSYKCGQYVVKNVTFAVNAGECFGLLGKNGAGKSTIFKILSGQMKPNMGSVTFFDGEISYCPQTNTLDSLLTVRECIEFYGQLRRVKDIPRLVDTLLESFQLEAYKHVLVKNLSGGNRRKLTVATTCCGYTSAVLMDEPTSDMDPVTRALVYQTIQNLLAEQRAIVLTSHSISEIDEICHRIAVLKEGQILTCSTPESLKAQYGGFYNVTVFCDQSEVLETEKSIHQCFPHLINLQNYTHSIKFSVKIDSTKDDYNVNDIAVDVPLNGPENTDCSLSLAQLFQLLSNLSEEKAIRFTINRCRLDTIFDRILDSSEQSVITNGVTTSPAYAGSPSLGYVHNGYVETETTT